VQQSRRRWRYALAAVVAGLVALTVGLRTERAGEWVCAQLREQLPGLLEADVSLGRCAIDPLTASVEISQVTVTPRGAATAAVSAQRASVALRGVFLGGVALQEVELIRPRVTLTVPEAAPEGAPAPAPGCPLDAISRVRVGRLRVEEGRLELTLPGARQLVLDGLNVEASLGRSEAAVQAHARGGSLAAEGRVLRLGRLAVEGALDPGAAAAEVQRAEVNVEGASVSLSGTLEALCDRAPSLALAGQAWVPLEVLGRLGVPVPPPSGQLLARLSVSGRVDGPIVRAQVQGSRVALGPYSPGDFSAEVVASGKQVSLTSFSTKVGDGVLSLTAELSLEQGFPLTASIDAKDVSFARAMARAGVPGAWVEFPATVKGTVSGRLSPSPVLGGDIDFKSGAFLLAARAWDGPRAAGRDILAFKQATGRFRFGVTSEVVSFEDVLVKVGAREATRVRGTVKLFPHVPPVGLDIEASSEALDLSDFGAIAELPWSGLGQVRLTVKGPASGIAVDGQLSLRDFKFDGYSLGVVQSPVKYSADVLSFPSIAAQKGQTQYFGDVALSFLDEGLHARATVQLPDGRVEDMVDLLADLSTVIPNLQGGVLAGRLSALAAVDSPVSALEGVIAMRVRDARYLGRRLGEADVVTRFENGEAMVLEPTRFEGPLGVFAVDGRWRFDGPLDYRLAIERGSLAELLDPAGVDSWPVGGAFVAKGTVGGTTDRVLMNGWISSSDVLWKQRGLGPMHLDASLDGREVKSKGTVFPGLELVLKMTARNEWPFTADLDVNLPDLSPFLPASAASLTARTRGKVSITGPWGEVNKMHAVANLPELAVARGEVTATNVEPVVLAWRAGAIEVGSLQMAGPTTELAAAGTWGPSAVDLKTRGSVDLRLLSSLSSAVERTQGRLDFTAAFSGPVSAPVLAGSAELTDVRLGVKGQDLQVRALSGRADFSGSRVFVRDVQGFLNDGRLRVRGDLRLKDLALETVELQADLEEVTWQVLPDVPATMTGSLLLASRDAQRYQLSGGIEVERFRYAQPLALDSLLARAKATPSTSDARPDEWLRLDVDLSTGNDVRIENNLARAKLVGRLKLSGTNVKPVLTGAIETAEGAQAYFRNNTYLVQRGLLQFNGLWPTFDLSAQTQVREYLVSVKAFGRFEDPKVSLSSEPSLSDADIVSLLTLGVTSRERLTERSGAGLAAEALLTASGLDQQVQRFLNQNMLGLKDQQVRLTTSFNEATGTAEPAVTWESKVLSDNLKVGVTQPVTGRGTKAQAEYRFNQRVSARAQWDNQNQNTTVGNPGVEVRFRFEWE
jgi:translocation and assembly module TamB